MDEDESTEEEEYKPDEDDVGPGSSDEEEENLKVNLEEEFIVASEEEEEEEPYHAPKKTKKSGKNKKAKPTATIKKKPNSFLSPASASASSPFVARHPPRTTGFGRKSKASAISGSPTASSAVTDAAAAAGESAPGVLRMGAHAHNQWTWLTENRYEKQFVVEFRFVLQLQF